MSYTGFKGLGIRAKTLLALAFTLGFGISVLVLTLRGFLLNGFLRSEDKEMAQALRNVAGRVAVLLDDLAATQPTSRLPTISVVSSFPFEFLYDPVRRRVSSGSVSPRAAVSRRQRVSR
jgi:hypothetical protein